MKLDITIMAHPKRKEQAIELQKQIPKSRIVWDRKNNIWDTCSRAWLEINPKAEYGLVLQDDSIICKDFVKQAEKLLTGDYIYSFYAGNFLAQKIDEAIKKGEREIYHMSIFNEVALCMKTEHIKAMVDFGNMVGSKTDQSINRWSKLRKIQICYTIPSLVDHRDERSLYYEHYGLTDWGRARKAYKFYDNWNWEK